MSEKLNLDAAQQGARQAREAGEQLGATWVKSGQSAQMAARSLRCVGEAMLKASKAATEHNSRLPLIKLLSS